jgi:hypothetical protein
LVNKACFFNEIGIAMSLWRQHESPILKCDTCAMSGFLTCRKRLGETTTAALGAAIAKRAKVNFEELC